MSRELGFNFGSRFEPYAVGQEAALAEAAARIAAERQQVLAVKNRAELDLEAAEAQLSLARDSAVRRKAVSDELIASRDGNPREFSVGRGLFYISIGLLLLIGDLTVLSGVLAQLLGLSYRAEVGDSQMLVTEIVNNPSAAWDAFRNVIVLTSSVLFLGFFPKLFFDTQIDRLPTTYRRTLTFVLLLSVAAVLVTALARWGLDTARSTASDGTAVEPRRISDLASVLLGLALPYVSCFFFSVGVDRLGRRFDLWRAALQRRQAERLLRQASDQRRASVAEFDAREAEAANLAAPAHESQARSRADAEYAQGYSDGVVALVGGTGPGTIFNALRMVAMRRRLR